MPTTSSMPQFPHCVVQITTEASHGCFLLQHNFSMRHLLEPGQKAFLSLMPSHCFASSDTGVSSQSILSQGPQCPWDQSSATSTTPRGQPREGCQGLWLHNSQQDICPQADLKY